MARIRSIKPEFWVDSKIASLPKATALFFIAIWNFADDDGIFETDSRSLSLRIPIYRAQDIQKMVNALWKAGLIVCSPDDDLAMVRGWHHQRIDKKRDGKYKLSEILWKSWVDSKNAREESTQGSDRRGKDKIGEDRILTPPSVEADVRPILALQPEIPKRKDPPPTAATWEAYSEAYRLRYHVEPTRNAMVNGQLAHFVKRVPIEEAPAIARFYVDHSNGLYLSAGHAVSLLLRDAEKLRTEWLTGNRITRNTVRAVETRDHFTTQLRDIAEGRL
jgi:hypothetical protein